MPLPRLPAPAPSNVSKRRGRRREANVGSKTDNHYVRALKIQIEDLECETRTLSKKIRELEHGYKVALLSNSELILYMKAKGYMIPTTKQLKEMAQ
jgi:hypothetical protein